LKDFKIKIGWGANSGTLMDTKVVTLYDFVPSKANKYFSMVCSHQVEQASITVGVMVDFKIEDFFPPAPPPQPLSPEQIRLESDALATNPLALAWKALNANHAGAPRGDSYDEYRMGQRYRDGDGVAKDLKKAREWLAKAATQGNKDASRELNELASK
jgi:hypothetical protein